MSVCIENGQPVGPQETPQNPLRIEMHDKLVEQFNMLHERIMKGWDLPGDAMALLISAQRELMETMAIFWRL